MSRADTPTGPLSEEQLQAWKTTGLLVIDDLFTTDEVEQMLQWVEVIRDWPDGSGRHLNYYELVAGEQVLSRTENFLPFHSDFDALVKKRLYPAWEQLLSEAVVLFKEKINYKYPGTGWYQAHQDVHAHDTSPYAFQPYHVISALFLDAADESNGCLEIVEGSFEGTVLERNEDGGILDSVCEALDFKPIIASPGTLVTFDPWVPHRSARNPGPRSRRSLYFTINGESKGDLREQHLADRASGKPNTREINPNLFIAGQKPRDSSVKE